MTDNPASRLAAWLLLLARRGLDGHRADWAQAMAAETEACTSVSERLAWAWGCLFASLRLSAPARAAYVFALVTGVAAMAGWEWNADESASTVLYLVAIAAALGLMRPGSALLSGIATGLVVAVVIGFEAMTGVRPAYETRGQTLADSLHWMVLVIPALLSAATGGMLGRRLGPTGSRR